MTASKPLYPYYQHLPVLWPWLILPFHHSPHIISQAFPFVLTLASYLVLSIFIPWDIFLVLLLLFPFLRFVGRKTITSSGIPLRKNRLFFIILFKLMFLIQ